MDSCEILKTNIAKLRTDILIIGAGPAGIFTALELRKLGCKQRINIIEKGKQINERKCPKNKTNECMKCKPNCNITTGFSGAGAFSDGKLSLSPYVGGSFPELIGYDEVSKLIEYTDRIYLDFGADTKVEGIDNAEEIREIRLKAIKAGLTLVECPIRHLGTEKAHQLYSDIDEWLYKHGVEVDCENTCKNLIIKDNKCIGAIVTNQPGDDYVMLANKVIVATGRRGADWLDKICNEHGIDHRPGTIDIGVRVEVRNEVMEKVNRVLYESKLIGYPEPFRDKVRTFCQNPGGFVAQENYDYDLAVVNGHSYKELKSDNTNLAILSSHNFTNPFNQPIEYAQKVGELTNMLGSGHILVQRFGDILNGKRTWDRELHISNVKPTLKDAVAGDITAAMPYRTMTNIVNFIKALDIAIPGFASPETLLYSPEVKFYSNKIKLTENLETSIENLYCIGDSSGWTRGLMMASVMGVYLARLINR